MLEQRQLSEVFHESSEKQMMVVYLVRLAPYQGTAGMSGLKEGAVGE
jgi:hypothetical protein